MENYMGTSYVGVNPRHVCHMHQMFLHIMTLIDQVLTPIERHLVMLHCGLGESGAIVGFSELASTLSLRDATEARLGYRNAIIKIRKAIPGSEFENWVITYEKVYRFSKRQALCIDPYALVPDWETKKMF